MAASTLAVKGHDLADVVVSGGSTVSMALAAITPKGCIYKDTSRALILPNTVEFLFNIGPIGSKGNDKLIIQTRQTLANTGATGFVTGGCRLEMSAPRDAVWTSTFFEYHLGYLCSVIGLAANRASLAAGNVP